MLWWSIFKSRCLTITLSDESDVKMIESQHGEETEDFLEEANEQ